jgi:hypothetical protein
MTLAYNLAVLLQNNTSTFTITGNTPSTSTTTGALVVAGGAGVGGNINVGGSVTIGGVTINSTNLVPQSYQVVANGISAAYTLSFTPIAVTGMIVTIDGLVEYDYTLSTNVVTFGFVPANNSIIRIFSMGIPGLVSTATIAPGTVGTSSFQAGAIVGGLGYTPVNKAGDTLTGSFVLNGWPLSTSTVYNTATVAQHLAGTSNTVALTPNGVWTAAAPVALTDAGTINVDLSSGINFTLTLTAAIGATRQLGNLINAKPGQTGWIQVTQSSSGNNAITFGNQWHFSTGTNNTLSTSPNVSDIIYYTALSSTYFQTNIAKYWI